MVPCVRDFFCMRSLHDRSTLYDSRKFFSRIYCWSKINYVWPRANFSSLSTLLDSLQIKAMGLPKISLQLTFMLLALMATNYQVKQRTRRRLAGETKLQRRRKNEEKNYRIRETKHLSTDSTEKIIQNAKKQKHLEICQN